MSYDTYLITEEGHLDIGNYTSNVHPMFALALPGPYSGGGKYDGEGDGVERGGLPGLSGLRCKYALPHISAGITYMLEHFEEMEELNPENGWGCAEGALDYLFRIALECARHPDATLCVNW